MIEGSVTDRHYIADIVLIDGLVYGKDGVESGVKR
jgi:hypothetical protein